MQMVLMTRRSLMSQLHVEINSFEAIEAESGRQKGEKPAAAKTMPNDNNDKTGSRLRTRQNCNQEGGLFVNETAHACAGAGIASTSLVQSSAAAR